MARPPATGHSPLFTIALPLAVVLAGAGILAPSLLIQLASGITGWFFGRLDGLIMIVFFGFLAVPLGLAVSRHGRLSLGAPGQAPEFSTVAWLAMLFAAGMGSGLVFWGVAEPLTHFGGAPGLVPGTVQGARRALLLTDFHWGLHAWGVYCLAGLVIAYFGFRRGTPSLPGSPLREALQGPAFRVLAQAADFLAVLAIVFGVAGSLGMGCFQIRSGLHLIAGSSTSSLLVPGLTLLVLVASYMGSALSGLARGIKWLSHLNMTLAIGLALAVLVAGPTLALLRGIVEDTGSYLLEVLPLSFRWYQTAADRQWHHTWTLTNFIWWIAWAPFVGVFIARISRGRTIRQFVAGVLLAPTAFTIVWFGIFGGSGLHGELHGAGGLTALARSDVSSTLFALLGRLPLGQLLSGVTIGVVFLFLVTSVDSATFVLAMFTSRGSLDPPLRHRVAWGSCLGVLGAALMLTDSVQAVRAAAVLGAIPYSVIMVLQGLALLRALHREPAG